MGGYRRRVSSSYAFSRPRRRVSASELRRAREVFEARSKLSRRMDLARLAKIAPDVEVWVKAPNRWDIPGVDTPDALDEAVVKKQAKSLAEAAKKQPVTVEVREKGKPKAHYRIERKKEEREEPKKEEAKPEKKPKGEAAKEERKPRHRTPTKEEILEKATELYMKEHVAEGLPAITPEEEELKEGGYYERAREELMRGEASKVDSAFLEYLHQLKGELEPMGYTIVPLSPDAPAI